MAKVLEEKTNVWTALPNYPGAKYAPGTIKNVENLSGTKLKSGKVSDVYLKFDLIFEDNFKKQIHLFANYIIDANSKRTGINSYSSVVSLLSRTLGKKAIINDDYTIPLKTLVELEGRTVLAINYISGTYNHKETGEKKPSYNIFDKFKPYNKETVETDILMLTKEFQASIESGWTKYTPDVLEKLKEQKEEEDDSFNYGANVEEPEDPFGDGPIKESEFDV